VKDKVGELLKEVRLLAQEGNAAPEVANDLRAAERALNAAYGRLAESEQQHQQQKHSNP
jgi:hypothetical protein